MKETRITVFLKDSEGAGFANKTIAISSIEGNALSASSLTTDSSGRAYTVYTSSLPIPAKDGVQMRVVVHEDPGLDMIASLPSRRQPHL